MLDSVSESLSVKPRNSYQDLAEVRSLANQILQDPLQQQQLCDRVYQLMQEDLLQQQKRYRSYGGRY